MKKTYVRRIIISGFACILLMEVLVWYSVTFNDSRLVIPMDFSVSLAFLDLWGS